MPAVPTGRRLLYTLLCTVLCLAAGGCVSDDGPDCGGTPEAGQEYRVSFMLTALGTSSRAVAETDTPGNGRENYIDPENSQFLLFTADDDGDDAGGGKYIAALTPEYLQPVDDSEYPSQWTVTAVISSIDGKPLTAGQLSGKYRIVVLANTGYGQPPTLTAGETTLKDLCESVKYDFTAPPASLETVTIPMYGVLTVDGSKLAYNPQMAAWAGTIHMLRAMAKVEVRLAIDGDADTDIRSAKIHGAWLTQYNTGGYVCPSGIYSNTKSDWDKADLTVTTRQPHIPSGQETETVSSTNFIIGDAGLDAVSYVPEFANKDAGTHTRLRVDIEFEGTNIPMANDTDFKLPTAEESDGLFKYNGDIKDGSGNVIGKISTDVTDGTPLYKWTSYFTIDIGEYSDGEFTDGYYNLLRNYHYLFTINSAGSVLGTVQYTVCEWGIGSVDIPAFQ